MSSLGIITGLKLEADCLGTVLSSEIALAVCGPGPDHAGAAARNLVAEGCGAIISAGFAGGLDPSLEAGAVVIAERIVDNSGRTNPCDPGWRTRLVELLADEAPLIAPIAGCDEPVTTRGLKESLASGCGAAAADMESHAVAAVAMEDGIPFIALRVVADPLHRAVPGAALAGISADGESRPAAVLGALLLRPWEIAGVISLARDVGRAADVLRRVARRAAPLFALR